MLALPAALLAAGAAGYTAFLFGQCEGRDLWQTPLLLPILLAQAIAAGGATYSVLDVVMDVPDVRAIRVATLAALGALAVADGGRAVRSTGHGSTASRNAVLAIAEMTKGRYAARFWGGGIGVGIVAPAVLLAIALGDGQRRRRCPAIAGLLIVSGLFCYEDAFVGAGQSVPLS